jgi:phosphoglycerate dehydrogenase-like enzyme
MSSSPKYWNREEFSSSSSNCNKIQQKGSVVVQEARIVSLSNPNDPANAPLQNLPEGAKILSVGSTIDELDIPLLQKERANVLFVSPGPSAETLAQLIQELENSLQWIHTRSAGIDAIFSPTLSSTDATLTNAKGAFSSTLAEYTMMACSYFAKDLPRLLKNKQNKDWNKYSIKELRGSTLGIIGYGDIGRATAKLAKVYGMKVIALRRNPHKVNVEDDPYCDVVYGNDQLNTLFEESDYVLCSAPLTSETKGMITKRQFDCAKKDCVFINVGTL